jgi:hypothetical protein
MYYPKSQIKTNLYTNRDEYALATTKELYRGYYYEISTGQKFTGKFPKDGPNILLVPYSPEGFNYTDRALLSQTQITTVSNSGYNKTLPLRSLPIFNPTTPTLQDQQTGQFNRYFCKKNNELKYLEIDKDTYLKLQSRDPKIAWDIYTPTILSWLIKGNKEQVFNSNKGTAISIEQNLNWTGFLQYFQDKFLKYYLES